MLALYCSTSSIDVAVIAPRLWFRDCGQNEFRKTVKPAAVANGPWIVCSRWFQPCIAPNFSDVGNILRSELMGPGFNFLSFLGREGLRQRFEKRFRGKPFCF